MSEAELQAIEERDYHDRCANSERDISTLIAEVRRLQAQQAAFDWQPETQRAVEAGSMESAVIGWRNRCLAAEKKLSVCLMELGQLRQELFAVKQSTTY